VRAISGIVAELVAIIALDGREIFGLHRALLALVRRYVLDQSSGSGLLGFLLGSIRGRSAGSELGWTGSCLLVLLGLLVHGFDLLIIGSTVLGEASSINRRVIIVRAYRLLELWRELLVQFVLDILETDTTFRRQSQEESVELLEHLTRAHIKLAKVAASVLHLIGVRVQLLQVSVHLRELAVPMRAVFVHTRVSQGESISCKSTGDIDNLEVLRRIRSGIAS
jgi:hypothetical protein